MTFRILAILIPLLSLPFQAVASDGMFADFDTSLGDFTCSLDYTNAPMTVASFVGLATGERPWIDQQTGEVHENTPYYDGLTVHRVSAGFVIQAGSPNGQGNDGPGYTFPDEVTTNETHDAAGILSMANTGDPARYTNGSQFFVTLTATPFLDYKHTVFGYVTSGMSTVNTIGSVPVVNPGVDEHPVTPVIINSVTIRRVGAAAQAFDIDAQGLPDLDRLKPTMTVDTNDARLLTMDLPAYTASSTWCSPTNITSWIPLASFPSVNTNLLREIDYTVDTQTHPRVYYRSTTTTYPGPSPNAPSVPDLLGTQINYSLHPTGETWNFFIASSGATAWSFNSSGFLTVSQVSYTDQDWHKTLDATVSIGQDGGGNDIFRRWTTRLHFDTPTSGRFIGVGQRLINNGGNLSLQEWPSYGTFTVNPFTPP